MSTRKTPLDAAVTHVSGESIYIDDRPPQKNELHVAVLISPHAHAKIVSIDASAVLTLPGVAGVYSAKDFAHNRWGTIFEDQPFLAEEVCQYAGEPYLLIAADNPTTLRKARQLIKVEFEELEPILSIDKAIEREQFIGPTRTIKKGDVEKAFREAPHQLAGTIEMGGQDHFYLESQASIAYPGENGQMEIHSSSQHPTEVQHVVAHALGIKYHQVISTVKRMGGAFGGKESQAAQFAAMAALVAQKTGRPARLILNKDDDMRATGKRNPFKNHYRVAYDEKGRILALKVELYSNAGAYADLSTAIMERAMLHCDNTYFIPNVEIHGTVCRTNHASNTAFRGFGGPKGVVTIENIIEEISLHLDIDALEIRKLNVYQKGQEATPYGQVLEENPLPELFSQLENSSDYQTRRRKIDEHNKTSKETVRGLSLTAIKFGISFTTRFLNQASALVNIHMDGTVQVSTGATEMGQGVNTKTAQVVAESLGIAPSDVKVLATSTEKNHNTSPTAASSGSDLNGQAALNACEKIKARLAQVAQKVFSRPKELRGRKVAGAGTAEEIKIDETDKKSLSDISFEDGWVFEKARPDNKISLVDLLEEAYLNRISLGDHGFYRYDGIHYNKETGQGQPFFYYTNGVAASEVSIDRFTGEVKVLRSDILMDLGRSINHGIDRGQIAGGFVQGMGWLTTESLCYNEKGQLLSHSPSTYKIPSVHDIPRAFNIDLLDNPNNAKNLRGSKAVGEPPLLLSISVWTAIKNALAAANQGQNPQIRIPATQEEIFWALPQKNKLPEKGKNA